MDLKNLRIRKGLTQVELAKMVGVTANGYRNWEYGANKPTEEHYLKLKEILEGDK